MTKPDITLEPSKGVVSQMAAQIYAAYVTRGAVKDGEEANWMQRSIREAVRIAKTVDVSIESDDEPNSDVEPSGAETPGAGVSASDPTASGAAASAERAAPDLQFDNVVEEALSEEGDATYRTKE